MNENGNQQEPKKEGISIGSGPPPRYFGIPEEPWEDGALYVLKVDGRQAWLERFIELPGEGLDKRRGGTRGVSAKNRTSTAEFEAE